jgi:hypothetical protein
MNSLVESYSEVIFFKIKLFKNERTILQLIADMSVLLISSIIHPF